MDGPCAAHLQACRTPHAPLILTRTLTLSLALAPTLSLSLTRWFGFFSTFFTMFTAAPLMSEIRKPSSLNLSNADIVQADICAVLPPPSEPGSYPYPYL